MLSQAVQILEELCHTKPENKSYKYRFQFFILVSKIFMGHYINQNFKVQHYNKPDKDMNHRFILHMHALLWS